MATSQVNDIIRRLRGVSLRDGSGMTDDQLLERFVGRQDESAFAALVRRHGPMVRGVCRRILHSRHDAEDAFQATFFVLVRRAGSVVPRRMVASWLYGVARQTAVKARTLAARRRCRERPAADSPEPAARIGDASEVTHAERASKTKGRVEGKSSRSVCEVKLGEEITLELTDVKGEKRYRVRVKVAEEEWVRHTVRRRTE